jgi:hypothetical protein
VRHAESQTGPTHAGAFFNTLLGETIMLQSYEAIYDHGRIRWLTDAPPVEEARVIVTMLPLQAVAATRPSRKPSARIAGKGRILGDIVAPAAPEDDWDALK